MRQVGRRIRLRGWMRRAVVIVLGLMCGAPEGTAQRATRLMLIPLDDRPSSVRFPVRIGAIAGAEVVTPPAALLGRFTQPADADAVRAWMRRQLLGARTTQGSATAPFDALIVSVDLLAYGGLVASRTNEHATLRQAIARLDVLREIRARYPTLPIYASASLMRIAPTADGRNEAYREALARWAELAPDSLSPAHAAEFARLRSRIPSAAIQSYRAARARNLAVHERLIDLAAAGVLSHLAFTQDDARPRGVHVAERAQLAAQVAARGLGDRISIQMGTDEYGMLLVARALTTMRGMAPATAVMYTAPRDSARAMPFEDRALAETVRAHLRLAGARVADGADAAALRLIVHTDRGAPTAVVAVRASPQPVILADIDPIGSIQGADTLLTDALMRSGHFASLTGYGAWNTAGNAIGTAVAHGVVRWLAIRDSTSVSRTTARADREAAQAAFLLDRWLDDDLFKSRIRPGLLATVRARGWDPFRFTEAQTTTATGEIHRAVEARMTSLGNLAQVIGPHCRLAAPIAVRLPWGRTFEAAFDFAVRCEAP